MSMSKIPDIGGGSMGGGIKDALQLSKSTNDMGHQFKFQLD